MKKYILSIIIILIPMLNLMSEEIDIRQKPEPLSDIKINFPSYSVKKLSNDIKVFIIQDTQQPTIAFRFLIPGGTSLDSIAGTADLTASLLTKGTKKRSALDIANTLDGVGVSYSANAQADYITYYTSGLKKHIDIILETASDMMQNPSFPKDEFEKMRTQYLNAVQLEKANPGQLAQNLARMVVFGEEHPYSKRKTEESLNQIKLNDIKDFYSKFFVPNNISIAVIGDVNDNEIIPILEKYFGNWEKGKQPEIKIPQPKPMNKGVHFVHRPGSAQSSVIITSPGVRYTHPDYLQFRIAGNLIGSGFAGRLFRTLRETHSFTYSPFGYLTSVKYTNRFVCGADVKKEKTDSSITVIFEQLNLLANETPSNEEIYRIKNVAIGNHLMSFERTQNIASLIQNADFMGQAIQDVENLHNLIQRIAPVDLQRIAQKYMTEAHSFIVVVAEPSIRETLTGFGKIYDYNIDLNPISLKMEEVKLSPNDLIKKYVDAIGGQKKLENAKTMLAEAKVEINAGGQQLSGKQIVKKKHPLKSYQVLEMMGMQQQLWSDGTNAWSSMMPGVVNKLEADDAHSAIFQGAIFSYARLLEFGFKCQVLGKSDGLISLKALSPQEKEMTIYFDANTYLINKIESLEEGPQGHIQVTQIFSDYKEFDGIKMPTKINTQSPFMTMNAEFTYKLNVEFKDSEFKPEE